MVTIPPSVTMATAYFCHFQTKFQSKLSRIIVVMQICQANYIFLESTMLALCFFALELQGAI